MDEVRRFTDVYMGLVDGMAVQMFEEMTFTEEGDDTLIETYRRKATPEDVNKLGGE